MVTGPAGQQTGCLSWTGCSSSSAATWRCTALTLLVRSERLTHIVLWYVWVEVVCFALRDKNVVRCSGNHSTCTSAYLTRWTKHPCPDCSEFLTIYVLEQPCCSLAMSCTLSVRSAGQACVHLSCLAPDFATAERQLANAILHFESVSISFPSAQGSWPVLSLQKRGQSPSWNAWACMFICAVLRAQRALSIKVWL